MVINLPVHAKLEVAVAECFRDSPVANWDKYTNLLERLVNKHVTFKLNAGNNQITFFSDKRLEKSSTQTDIEHAVPAAVLYVETKQKRRPPSGSSSPASKTVGPVRTRSKSVDQLAEKPRSLGARGSKTYVNAMEREERLKKAVSTGDILKDTKNKKNKNGSEKGSFSGWLFGTLTGRRKKKRPTVIESNSENDKKTNNDAGNKPNLETQTERKEATPVVQNGRGRKVAKSAEKSAEKRSKSQPARQKQKAPKKENGKVEQSASKGEGQSKKSNKKAGNNSSSQTKEVPNKVKETEKSDVNNKTQVKENKTPVKAKAPSAPKAQASSTPKSQAPPSPTNDVTQKSSPKSDQSTPTSVKKNNQTNSKTKLPKQVKDSKQQTEKTPKEKRDNSTSTTPRSILKKGNTPSVSSFSSNSSLDGRMDASRPERRNGSVITDLHRDTQQDRLAEGPEFYATLRKNMPVDIPVPDYKKQEMEHQRALSAYATTPRSSRGHNNQMINNNWRHQSDIINVSPNQHIVDAVIHRYPEDETDYMNAEVEMFPHHIYANNTMNGTVPPSPPPPPAFQDPVSQQPAAPLPPPLPPVFNSQRADFTRSVSEEPYNEFASQLAKLRPVQQQSPRPKPQNQTVDLMTELKMATERRKSQSDLVDGLTNQTFNNGYAPRRESDAYPFKQQKLTNGGTLPPPTKRQFSSPAIHYTPRTGPQTQPKPFRNRISSNNNEIRSMADVPRNLKGVNVAQISECMRLLNLEKYIETFKTHKIDGDMLVDLNKEMLKSDLGMSEIDAAKIMKFATGWRPQ
ncbi:uncharacterized protein [Antedon mediterranea]